MGDALYEESLDDRFEVSELYIRSFRVQVISKL
jgi:hypothetical protein